MKNTGIVYDSAEKTPVVLPEIADLLPPLTDKALSLLEEDIRAKDLRKNNICVYCFD